MRYWRTFRMPVGMIGLCFVFLLWAQTGECIAAEYRAVLCIDEDLDGDRSQNHTKELLQGILAKAGLAVVSAGIAGNQNRFGDSVCQANNFAVAAADLAATSQARFIVAGNAKAHRNIFPAIEPLKSCRATITLRVIDMDAKHQVIWSGTATEGATDANYALAARMAVKKCLDEISGNMESRLTAYMLSLSGTEKWKQLVESLESASIHRLAVIPSDVNGWNKIKPYEARLISLGRTKFAVMEKNENIQNTMLEVLIREETSDMYDPQSLALLGKWLGVQAIVWVDVQEHWVKVLKVETARILFQDRLLP